MRKKTTKQTWHCAINFTSDNCGTECGKKKGHYSILKLILDSFKGSPGEIHVIIIVLYDFYSFIVIELVSSIVTRLHHHTAARRRRAIATPTIVMSTSTIRVWRVVGRMMVATSWGRGAMSVRVEGEEGEGHREDREDHKSRAHTVARWTTVRE